MSQIATVNDIKSLGTILSVWAHPDDESYCCAGLMATAVQNGQKVVCVTATKGEAGVQDAERWPPNHLGEIRARELEEALQKIGVNEHHWLGYKDGHCQEVPLEEAVSKVRKIIDKYKPNTILTFGPDGITGHPDHKSVSRWVSQAVAGTGIAVYHAVEEQDHFNNYMQEQDKKFNIYFNIDKPPVLPANKCDIAYNLTGEILECKCQAIKAMPSQTETMVKNTSPEVLNAMLGLECFVKA